MSDGIKRIDIKEFREVGFLQEANRLFFHPLGLALEVVVDDDGAESLGGVWDYRDDPEGIVYGADTIDAGKARYVAECSDAHADARRALFGAVIQPVDGVPS